MQDEYRRILPGPEDAVVDILAIPLGKLLRFALGQLRFHREIGARKVKRTFEVQVIAPCGRENLRRCRRVLTGRKPAATCKHRMLQ